MIKEDLDIIGTKKADIKQERKPCFIKIVIGKLDRAQEDTGKFWFDEEIYFI